MIAVHAALANALLLLLVISLGWSAFGIVSGRGVAPGLRGTVGIALGVAVLQLLIGLVLLGMGRPLSGIHLLYGLAVITTLAGAVIYGTRLPAQREVLIYALVTLFGAGLTLRAVETAGRFG